MPTSWRRLIVDVINQYVRFPLPRHWGSGRTAIADGTHVKLRENNLMGSRHIRYGGYGGIAYHHIADTYIPCSKSGTTRRVSNTHDDRYATSLLPPTQG